MKLKRLRPSPSLCLLPENVSSSMREPRELPQSTKLKQIVDSACAGDAAAQDAVGQLFQYGVEVTSDFTEAAYWYDLAANQDYAPALRHLAWLYENGLGVAADIEGAKELLLKAAKTGDTESAFFLGQFLSSGPEPTRDPEDALKWLRKAEDAGHPDANEARKRLERKIDVSSSPPTEDFTMITPSLDKIAEGGEWSVVKLFVKDGDYVGKDEPLVGYVYKLDGHLVMYGFVLAKNSGFIEKLQVLPSASFQPGEELLQFGQEDGELISVCFPLSFDRNISYEVGSIQISEGDFVRPGQPVITLKSEVRSQDGALRNYLDPPVEKAGRVSKVFVNDGTIIEQNEAIMTVECIPTATFIEDPFEYLLTAFPEKADEAPDLLNFVGLHFGWTQEETNTVFECLSQCVSFPKDKLLRLRSALLGKWTHRSRKKGYHGGPQDIEQQATCTLSRNGDFNLNKSTVTKTDTSFEQRKHQSMAAQKFSQAQQIAAMGGSSSFVHEVTQRGSDWDQYAADTRSRAQPKHEGSVVEGIWFLNGPKDIVVIRGQGKQPAKFRVTIQGTKLRIDQDLYDPLTDI